MRRPVPAIAACAALLTLALMTLGGVVHAAGASLACPDWPLCHGRVMPPMVGGVALEHSHRLLGALVGTMALALAVVATRSRHADVTDRRLAWAAVVIVGVQAVLGGATVLVRLSPVLSTLHLAVAMAFLAVLITLAARGRNAHGPASDARADGPLRRTAGATVVVLYAQMILGGLVRHTHAAMACGTDPWLCGGALWPEGLLPRLHMTHRLLALVVTLLLIAVVARARHASDTAARHLGWAAGMLVIAQLGLGVASVVGVLPVPVVTAHLAGAALLWGTVWLLWLRAAAYTPVPRPRTTRSRPGGTSDA